MSTVLSLYNVLHEVIDTYKQDDAERFMEAIRHLRTNYVITDAMRIVWRRVLMDVGQYSNHILQNVLHKDTIMVSANAGLIAGYFGGYVTNINGWRLWRKKDTIIEPSFYDDGVLSVAVYKANYHLGNVYLTADGVLSCYLAHTLATDL